MEERIPADFLLSGAACLATVAGPPGPLAGRQAADLGELHDASLAAYQGRIVAVGWRGMVESKIDLAPGAIVINAAGKCVLPGFVDPHTHIVYAGDRADEYALRQAGATYAELLAAGGGILATVRRTRAATDDDLFRQSRARLRRMLAQGTTTVEIKSGYALDVAGELRMLRVAQRLGREESVGIVPTLLGAHALPPEFVGQRERYVDLVCEEMVPAAAAAGLAAFCDVFCEEGAFTVAESRRILEAGRHHGLRPKLHADQLSASGGALLAAELAAVSADHLDFVDEEGMRALAGAGVVAVLLPGASLILRHRRHAPARQLVEAGVPIAIATDSNPGSCPIESMPIIMGLACALLGLTPAEALVAATRNAAYAVGCGDRVGSLEVGKRADLVVVDAPAPHYLPYRFGQDLVQTVVIGGKVVVHKESSQE